MISRRTNVLLLIGVVTSRGICLAQLAWRSAQALPSGLSSIPSACAAKSVLTGWMPTTFASAPKQKICAASACETVPVGNVIRLADEAESRNVSSL
jgi:hypothetical protein